jgi:hypothetical protein
MDILWQQIHDVLCVDLVVRSKAERWRGPACWRIARYCDTCGWERLLSGERRRPLEHMCKSNAVPCAMCVVVTHHYLTLTSNDVRDLLIALDHDEKRPIVRRLRQEERRMLGLRKTLAKPLPRRAGIRVGQ